MTRSRAAWDYDLDGATALLEEAGYDEVDSDGYRVKDGQRLTIQWAVDSLYVQTDQRQQLGEAIASSLKKAGFEVIRTPYDTSSFTASSRRASTTSPTHRAASPTSARASSPFCTRTIPSSNGGSGINYGLLSDPRIDEAYGIISTNLDPAARIEAAHEVQGIILDEGYAVPLYVPKKIVGTTPEVQGWKFDAVGYTDSFYDVWLSE